jgi:flagellar basal body-associated protein FliL
MFLYNKNFRKKLIYKKFNIKINIRSFIQTFPQRKHNIRIQTMDNNITVLPNLSNQRFSKQPQYSKGDSTDSVGIESILKSDKSSSFDVLGMKHEPTEEESKKTEKGEAPKSSWNLVIVALVCLVIVLIIVIAWYLLRETPADTKVDDTNNDMRQHQHTTQQEHMAQQQRMAQQQMNARMGYPMQEQCYQQSEQLPINTQSMDNSKHTKPTKAELEDTLSKMETMDDEPTKEQTKLKKPRPAKTRLTPVIEEVEEDEDDTARLDKNLTKHFNNDMEKNMDMDDNDSDNEEGRG